LLIRALIAISACILAIGLTEYLFGSLPDKQALILTGYTLGLIWILFLFFWTTGQNNRRKPPSILRKILQTILLFALAGILARATISYAPPWLIEKMQKGPRRQAPNSPAIMPNVAPMPDYPAGEPALKF
jgi:hypothetical protein